MDTPLTNTDTDTAAVLADAATGTPSGYTAHVLPDAIALVGTRTHLDEAEILIEIFDGVLIVHAFDGSGDYHRVAQIPLPTPNTATPNAPTVLDATSDRATPAPSRADAEHGARADLAAAVADGVTVRVRYVIGYPHGSDDQLETYFDPPITARVVGGAIRWVDEHLDPYWDLDPTSHPDLASYANAWTYGPSHVVTKN